MFKKEMLLYGLREEKYLEKGREYFDVIFLLKEEGILYEYSQKKKILRKVKTFISPTYITKSKKIKIDVNFLKIDYPFENEVISHKCILHQDYVSALNEDIHINIDAFENQKKKSKRYLEKRPVWIFKGDSMLGKSYIASFLNENKEIYETDSCETLPSTIYADIIVLGNKYKYTINEIKLRIPSDSKIIEVEFK